MRQQLAQRPLTERSAGQRGNVSLGLVVQPQPLEADGDTLRVTGGNGYGSYGESYAFTFDTNGAVETVRGSSGLTLQPIDTFTLPDRVSRS